MTRIRSIDCRIAFRIVTLAGLITGAATGLSDGLPSPRFLSGPAGGDALDIAMQHVRATVGPLGLRSQDLDEVEVQDRYVSAHNGVTHINARQCVGGIEIFGADLSANVAADGRIATMRCSFLPLVDRITALPASLITAEEAVLSAAAHVGLPTASSLSVRRDLGGAQQAQVFAGGEVSADDIPVKLMLYPASGDLKPAWNLVLRDPAGDHWWHVNVDAVTGIVLWKNDWVFDSSYTVYALPLESPLDGDRSMVFDPDDLLASPYTWHDTDGPGGSSFIITDGNNVSAQDDANANNSGGLQPSGGPSLVFDFPLNLQQAPSTYQSASIVNLYYWNNILHDIHYRYGFTEPSGNFQANNYGNGGIGGDAVQADAQDGNTVNNANFAAPPDGLEPRMQMFIWNVISHAVAIHSPSNLIGTVSASGAAFGPVLNAIGLTGNLVLALDGVQTTGTVTDACSPLTNTTAIAGNIALIDRGDCLFVDKVKIAQDAGAVAAIIVNNQGDELVPMGGTDPIITIPSVFIAQSDGDRIKAALASGVNVTLTSSPNRDSALDNGIVIHEYGHGVSTRLTGGPANSDCLDGIQSAGLGEGWSDWWTLVFTARPDDSPATPRLIGAYVSGPGGIRSVPYSTDMTLNPHTLADVAESSEEHRVGEIWATVLWDMYWNLVRAHGFDADLYEGTGGNNLAMQLVMDGLKLQPCHPTFLDARDAILMADQINNDGANVCLIWEAFAKRGMGPNAADGGSHNSQAVVEDFSVPEACPPVIVNAALANDVFTVNWFASSGAVYHVQASDDLENPAWTNVSGVITGLGAEIAFDRSMSGHTQHFHRVQLHLD